MKKINASLEQTQYNTTVRRETLRVINSNIDTQNYNATVNKSQLRTTLSQLAITTLSCYITRITEKLYVALEQVIQIATKIIKRIIMASTLNRRSYRVLIEITDEDMMRKERFLADYHTLQYIAKNSGLSIPDTAVAINNLSNLLGLCDTLEVDEIHAVSMRIVRITKNGKTYFLITEYAKPEG